jgi:hypothetical protein
MVFHERKVELMLRFCIGCGMPNTDMTAASEKNRYGAAVKKVASLITTEKENARS